VSIAAAVYFAGYIIAVVMMSEDDGPVAFVLAFAWPAIGPLVLFLRFVDWRRNRRAPDEGGRR